MSLFDLSEEVAVVIGATGVLGGAIAEGLAAALKECAAGQRILLARADRGRELLREQLAAVALVEQVAVYSQIDVLQTESLDGLSRGEIDYILLTSSNITRAFAAALEPKGREMIRTAIDKLQRLGLPVNHLEKICVSLALSTRPDSLADERACSFNNLGGCARDAYRESGHIGGRRRDLVPRGPSPAPSKPLPRDRSFPVTGGCGKDTDNSVRCVEQLN